MRLFRNQLVLVALFLAASAPAFSQAVNGTLVGTITDVTSAPVPDASVVITETNTGISQSTESNDSGNYSFNDLTPGIYTVTVEHRFQTYGNTL